MRYEIKGEPLPVVIVYLDAGESIKCEKGAMSWMTPNMKMETGAGSVGKAFSRMFSGESMFQNTYTAEGGPGMIAFASSFPGSIIPVDVSKGDFIVQKSGYLASEPSVELSIAFQKKLGAGFFGGEGLFNTVVTGPGKIYLQTMPISNVAGAIASVMPKSN